MRAAFFGTSVSACRWTAVILGALVTVLAADAARGDPAVDQAIRILTEEAQPLVEPIEAGKVPSHTRPHPVVEKLPASALPAVIDRLDGSFTGDAIADLYVRYHLLWLVQEDLHQRLDRFRETGSFTTAPGTVQALVRLMERVPEVPDASHERPAGAYEQLSSRITELRRSTEVVVGVAGAEVRYFFEEALPHVSRARQAEIRRAIQERDRLTAERDRIGRGMRDGADTRNRLRNARRDIVHRYRTQLMDAIVRGGDGAVLRRAVDGMVRLIADDQRLGYEMLGWVYDAAFDGSLSLYDTRSLEQVHRSLERAARRHDRYVELMDGAERANPNRSRNFADATFHLRRLLASPDVLQVLLRGASRAAAPPPPPPANAIRPEDLTLEDVEAAIARAVHALLDPPQLEVRLSGGRRIDVMQNMQPRYQPWSEIELRSIGSADQTNQWIKSGKVHEIGEHAVIAWALLQAGRTYQDPQLFRRINWVFASDTDRVYDRAMRALMAAQLPADQWSDYLSRDVDWLLRAMTTRGGFTDTFQGERSDAWGDHANAQYAVLALAAAAEAGVGVPGEAWEMIDRHWRLSQDVPEDGAAGWALLMLGRAAQAQQEQGAAEAERRSQLSTRPTVPMTAGGVATLIATERLLGKAEDGFSSDLHHGLAWLDRHFSLQQDLRDELSWYYYIWTLQRVGQASGYARFNGVDWFREVTAKLVNDQDPAGFWPGREALAEQVRGNTLKVGPGPSTAFALLYLGAALDPVAVSKVRYDGKWNQRPTDLWNFVDYASDQYEWDTTWRIVDADQPVHELIESPLLYLSVGDGFSLSDAEVAGLRDYVLAGGTLVLNPDRPAPDIGLAITHLVQKLFPDRPLEPVASDDPVYSLHREVRPSVQMRAIHNGVRPMVVTFVRDVGEDLQQSKRITSDAFATLSNLYLQAVGKNARRSRLQSSYVSEPRSPVQRTVVAARVAVEGAVDPEPAALTQLGRLLRRDHGVQLEVQTTRPAELDRQVPIAFLTTAGDAALSDADAEHLRQWVEQGGTLWLDAVGGSKQAVDAAVAMLQQIAPQQPPMPLNRDHPILTGEGLPGGYDNRSVRYRRYALQRMTPTIRPRLQAVTFDGRAGIIFSPEDLTAGWAGLEHWGIFGYDVASARQIGVNAVLDAIE